jgi:exodeoxyribonuclease VII large subunit
MNVNEQRLTLFELNRLVREVIEYEMPHQYWVEAELSECRESRGHCYMELIERSDDGATPIARASAKCWASRWMMIRPHFERVTGQRLTAGMKVLLAVAPQFHEAFGFSWIVSDIDPTFTLGDQARRRQEIIRQLKAEGVFDLQRELSLPLFCQNIAVISSATAAGYGDFCNQLADSPFAFRTQLFPAVMQGEGVEQSIIAALERIYSHKGPDPLCGFDCVVIIRGGGATSDLSGFDTLALAENVANFPIPIITGIGHERDECILDMISHTRVKTPTAAAAFLIDHLQHILDSLEDAQQRISRQALQKLADQKVRISSLNTQISNLFSVVRTRQEARLDQLFLRLTRHMQQQLTTASYQLANYDQMLRTQADRRLTTERHHLELLQEKLNALDPALLLSRGYSITTKGGILIRDPQQLNPGDLIETQLEKGTIRSVVS